jgi:hypothetical protein
MKSTLKAIISLLFFLIVAASCTEKITINVGSTYVRFVVDGHIATDTTAYQITLTKTADYFYNAPSPKVVDAKVKLSDGDTTYTLLETEPGNSGIYATSPSFYGKIGKTYTLSIQLADPIGGSSNYSASCALVHVAHLDSTKAVFHSEFGKNGAWEILAYAQDPPNEVNYYMFNLYRNGVLITDSIHKVRVSDDKLINGSYFDGAVLFLSNSRDDEKLVPGDRITLVMSGITKEYFDFVQQVQESGFNIPFFSGPPANIVGNISNGGVGFFAAYSNSYASAIVK